jgi:hypothetical protein
MAEESLGCEVDNQRGPIVQSTTNLARLIQSRFVTGSKICAGLGPKTCCPIQKTGAGIQNLRQTLSAVF